MVQSNYTVSTAQQLLGRMPAVRVSGSKSKPSNNSFGYDPTPAVYRQNRGPTPTKPLPPTPVNTVRERASASSELLPYTDKVKIRTDIPAIVTEDEVLTLPATVYTPATLRAKGDGLAAAQTVTRETARVPLLETPRKGREADADVHEPRISQYYEYITPPVSLMNRSGSRRERKASHTPTSSGGSADIYFSPIDATRSQVFLSSPQPSPPVTPTPSDILKQGEDLVAKVAALTVEPSSTERKVTLTLADVDRLTTALARAPLVQMRPSQHHPPPKRPPPSEASSSLSDSAGGIALINPIVSGAPVTHTTNPSTFPPGKCTHLSLHYGLSTSSNLRIEPAPAPNAESKILLQTLVASHDRKTGARAATLLAETDVTPSFARAALTELAAAQELSLDDVEIRTPTAPAPAPAPSSPEASIDWCAIGEEQQDLPTSSSSTLATAEPASDIDADVVDGTLRSFASASAFAAETCTMQTLTLLSELARLHAAHATFMVLQPTSWNDKGELAGVKIPLVSGKLRAKFEKMGGGGGGGGGSASSTASAASSGHVDPHGGREGRLCREAVIAAVAPRFVFGEEFETFVEDEKEERRVRARCVPLIVGEVVELWVVFLGGEFDVPY